MRGYNKVIVSKMTTLNFFHILSEADGCRARPFLFNKKGAIFAPLKFLFNYVYVDYVTVTTLTIRRSTGKHDFIARFYNTYIPCGALCVVEKYV